MLVSWPRARSRGRSAEPIRPRAPLTSTRRGISQPWRAGAGSGAGSDPFSVRQPCRPPYADFLSIEAMKTLRKSIGTGKIVVELFSVAIAASVCR